MNTQNEKVAKLIKKIIYWQDALDASLVKLNEEIKTDFVRAFKWGKIEAAYKATEQIKWFDSAFNFLETENDLDKITEIFESTRKGLLNGMLKESRSESTSRCHNAATVLDAELVVERINIFEIWISELKA